MAYIGVRKPYIAAFDTAHTGKYLAASFVGKATSFEETANTSESTLYADDGLAESERGVTSYGLSLGTSDIPEEMQEVMFGHNVTTHLITTNQDDASPYVGFAVIGVKQVDGVKKYEARVYPKTQWSEPGANFTTRGESTEFQSQTLTGVAMPDASGNLRYMEDFETETAAATFIASKLPVQSG